MVEGEPSTRELLELIKAMVEKPQATAPPVVDVSRRGDEGGGGGLAGIALCGTENLWMDGAVTLEVAKKQLKGPARAWF